MARSEVFSATAGEPQPQPTKLIREQEAEMNRRANFDEIFFLDVLLAGHESCASRRELLLAVLLAALPLALSGTAAQAGRINSSETHITLPDAIKWSGWINGFPPHSGEMATLYGGLDKPGPYLVLMKWYPGYMSAPHTYATDRLSLVLSGTWWVNSGADFDPDNTVPVPAGGFVRRVARTPHYDGVRKDAHEPAVIGLFGIAPVQFELVDTDKPAWRKL
jgi:hypothetical protein